MIESEARIAPSADPDAVNRGVAARLRALRRDRGWSLDRAALETGVSKAMLGQIERGESSPTVATLWKIAGGFHCSLTHFLAEPAAPAVVGAEPLVRRARTMRVRPASDDMLVAPLFPFDPALGFELFELTLLPGYVRLSEPHAAGVVEHVVVTSGRIDVRAGGRWRSLGPGDAIRFAADQPHGYRNAASDPATCLDLIHYPAQP